MAMMSAVRRMVAWRGVGRPPGPARERDAIGEDLRAAVAAEERAYAENVETYRARVDAMIAEFFVRYGERDARLGS